ncbi:MAG: hypothetical protein IAE77_24795 [Prosthecobacter sp.]|jgi:hypothetical protein|uniref:hypothetical protein n=1 Tax=Prosthecobacter sp. TaxID=1965333 RepID=UPI001A0B256F|nr:hypothetical protein [Prosthecobacter sp.]MBE2286698.1 hypothetical protein [Prosthecobacter sp.]
MPDAGTPAPENPSSPPATSAAHERGYFNQAQLEDIETAGDLLAAASGHAAELTEQDIDDAYLNGLTVLTVETRRRIAEAAGNGDASEAATAEARAAEKVLFQGLQHIQSAARQKHKMLAEDDDPETNSPLDGYLIGLRPNPSRTLLLQTAEMLIGKAKADSLPGFKTAARVASMEALLTAYRSAESGQGQATEDKGLNRVSRDALVQKINTRRSAVQHTADVLWPYTQETSRPIRKTFKLPLGRPMGG